MNPINKATLFFAEEPTPKTKPIVLRRSFSTSYLNQATLEKTEIAKKDGVMWKCIGRKPNPWGGFYYDFRLRKKYDSITNVAMREQIIEDCRDKNNSIYPALEYYRLEKIECLKESPYTFLGYSLIIKDGRVHICLPDKEALEVNWERLRQIDYRTLPRLEIISSEGVSSDDCFIVNHQHKDNVLSDGCEFFHDHLLHIVRTIEQLYHSPHERIKLIKLCAMGWKTFIIAQKQFSQLNLPQETFAKKMEIIQTVLSGFVDMATNGPTVCLSRGDYVLRQTMAAIWGEQNWVDYMEKRFTRETLETHRIKTFWHELLKLEIMHDVELNKSKPLRTLVGMDLAHFKRAGQRFLVNEPPYGEQIYTIVDKAKYQREVEYLVQGPDAEMTLKHWENLKIGEVRNLKKHPVLMDIACQFAAVHGCKSIVLESVPEDLSVYFKLGFRFQLLSDDLFEETDLQFALDKEIFAQWVTKTRAGAWANGPNLLSLAPKKVEKDPVSQRLCNIL